MFIGEKDKEKPETQDYITWDILQVQETETEDKLA